mmetsp:Transcript_23421/g.42024  ORF Transcript_23421/g.42024 Transcript_23421/m.42024 type:complete len:202 (-) Transcript_23421:1362-1967(-)
MYDFLCSRIRDDILVYSPEPVIPTVAPCCTVKLTPFKTSPSLRGYLNRTSLNSITPLALPSGHKPMSGSILFGRDTISYASAKGLAASTTFPNIPLIAPACFTKFSADFNMASAPATPSSCSTTLVRAVENCATFDPCMTREDIGPLNTSTRILRLDFSARAFWILANLLISFGPRTKERYVEIYAGLNENMQVHISELEV